METDGGTKPAVDERFARGPTNALRSWLLTSVPAPICLCKSFSRKACPGTDGGTKHPVDERSIGGRRPLFVPGC